MSAMPRPRQPYLHRYHTRHGKFYWYVRKPHGRRVRIRAEFGSPEFETEYRAAIGSLPIVKSGRTAKTGTLSWLWERYRDGSSWLALSAATKRQRENIMVRVLKAAGAEPYGSIRKSDVVAERDDRANTPAQARNFLDAMRGLFRWAADAGHVRDDPTAGVKNPKRPKGQGFPVWTEDEVDRYQTKWPVGTKERVWLDVLLYTGLRRGDAVLLGRQHVRDGFFTLRTEKSGEEVVVSNPVLPVLAKTLATGPCGDLAFICGASGKPLTKESFGNLFREACDKAGVLGKSAHGLRKIGATRAAENGATVAQLEALFGWRGGGMAALYTRSADRKRLAKDAGALMTRTPGEQPMCQPEGKVGTTGEIP